MRVQAADAPPITRGASAAVVCLGAMSRAANLVMGLVLIAAGASGLGYVNLELVPSLGSASGAREAPESPKTVAPPPVRGERVVTNAAAETPSSTAPVASAQASASAATPVETGPVAPVKFATGAAASRTLTKELEAAATWMKRNPGVPVALVGHGDSGQRGREYLDLGRARALAVRRSLLDWAVPVGRLLVIPPEISAEQTSVTNVNAGTVEVRVTPKGDR